MMIVELLTIYSHPSVSSNYGKSIVDNSSQISSFSTMSSSTPHSQVPSKTHYDNSTSIPTQNSIQNLPMVNKNYQTSTHSLSTENLSYHSTSSSTQSCYSQSKNMPNNNSTNPHLSQSIKTQHLNPNESTVSSCQIPKIMISLMCDSLTKSSRFHHMILMRTTLTHLCSRDIMINNLSSQNEHLLLYDKYRNYFTLIPCK